MWRNFNFYAWQMWRNLKFLHMWSNFKFLHMTDVEKYEVSPQLACVWWSLYFIWWDFCGMTIQDPNIIGWIDLQLAKSSRAIQWGAIFSAVSGWKSILMSAPEPYEYRECCGLLVLSLTLTLFTTSTKHHGSRWSRAKPVWWKNWGFVSFLETYLTSRARMERYDFRNGPGKLCRSWQR